MIEGEQLHNSPLCASGGMGACRPTSFPLVASAPRISRVRFTGDDAFTSLLGEWEQTATGFRLMIR